MPFLKVRGSYTEGKQQASVVEETRLQGVHNKQVEKEGKKSPVCTALILTTSLQGGRTFRVTWHKRELTSEEGQEALPCHKVSE